MPRYIVLNPVCAWMFDTPTNGRGAAGTIWSAKRTPNWLATDSLLSLFAKKRSEAIAKYINFVEQGVNKTICDDLQHQVFLGDETFVEKHQLMQKLLEADVTEIPYKQRGIAPMTLNEYQQQAETRNEAIIKAYQLGG
jgi:putative transposase